MGDVYFSFNEDGSLFVIGNSNGFKIYESENNNNNDPIHVNSILNIKMIQLNYKSNICAIVGKSEVCEGFSEKTVCIWDMARNCIFKSIEFKKKIRGIKFYRERLLICTNETLSIYKMPELSLIKCLATLKNNEGLFCCSSDKDFICAYPSVKPGTLSIYFSFNDSILTHDVHLSKVVQILLSEDGKFLFTCSEKGTIIRMFLIKLGSITLQKEFRRGHDIAKIYSLSISPNNSWLNVTSSTGTGHIFNLKNKTPTNKKSLLSCSANYIPSFLGNLSKYVEFEWSSFEYYGILEYKTFSFINNHANIIIFSTAGFIARYTAKMSTAYDVTMMNYDRSIVDKNSE